MYTHLRILRIASYAPDIDLFNSNLIGVEDSLIYQDNLWWNNDLWSYLTDHSCKNIYILIMTLDFFRSPRGLMVEHFRVMASILGVRDAHMGDM